MKRTAALALLASTAVFAQGFPGRATYHASGMSVQKVQPREHRADFEQGAGYRIRYYPNQPGRTQVRVEAPEGAPVRVWSGGQMLVEGTIPTEFDAPAGEPMRVTVRWPDGSRFVHRLFARAGTKMDVWISSPNRPPRQEVREQPVPVPQQIVPGSDGTWQMPPPMSATDFESLKLAIGNEAFSEQKLGVLRTAAGSAWFTCAQVGDLIDLYAFSSDKLAALAAVKDRIVDRQNRYQLIGHFTFSSDKESAQSLLQ